MNNKLQVGDILIPKKIKHKGYIFWKEAKFLVVYGIDYDSGPWGPSDQKQIHMKNEEGIEMTTNYSFISSLVEKGSIRLVRDESEKAKILLSQ